MSDPALTFLREFLTARARRASWVDLALCAEVDPAIFFPERDDGASTRDAKRVCRACPVRRQCLEYALETGAQHGVFGGLSPRERRRVRQDRARDAA